MGQLWGVSGWLAWVWVDCSLVRVKLTLQSMHKALSNFISCGHQCSKAERDKGGGRKEGCRVRWATERPFGMSSHGEQVSHFKTAKGSKLAAC